MPLMTRLFTAARATTRVASRHARRWGARAAARAGLLAALCAASSAHAAVVGISFGGFVTDVSDGLSLLNGLAPNGKNTRFTGGLSWDTSTPDADPQAGFGLFHGTVTNFWLDFGNGLVFTQGGPQSYNNVQTRNDGTDYGGLPFDGFYAYAQWDGSSKGTSYTELGISLQSLLLGALAGAGLPSGLDLNDFIDPDDLAGHDIAGVDKQSAGIEFHAVGPLTAAFSTDLFGVIDTATTVPEPATWTLLGIAALGAAAARRRAQSTV